MSSKGPHVINLGGAGWIPTGKPKFPALILRRYVKQEAVCEANNLVGYFSITDVT